MEKKEFRILGRGIMEDGFEEVSKGLFKQTFMYVLKVSREPETPEEWLLYHIEQEKIKELNATTPPTP